jgi:hypothetical protein
MKGNYSILNFLKKIENISGWEAMCLANKEATDAERILLKEKSLTGYKRDRISSYAKQLKEFVIYSRSSIEVPTMSQKSNPIIKKCGELRVK